MSNLGWFECADIRGVPDIWTPARIPTALWLDAADSSLVVQSSGVSQWLDKSGNSRHASAPLAGKPAYNATGINGRGSIVFPTTAAPLLVSAFDPPSGVIGFLVAMVIQKVSEPVSYSIPLTYGAANAQWSFVLPKSDVGVQYGQGKCIWRNRYVDSTAVTSVSDLGTTPKIVLGTIQDSVGMSLLFDANVEATRAPATHTLGSSAALTIGSSPDSTYSANLFNGKIGEIVVVYGRNDIATLDRLNGYLAHKWGLN